jgi:hypothetical protein
MSIEDIAMIWKKQAAHQGYRGLNDSSAISKNRIGFRRK